MNTITTKANAAIMAKVIRQPTNWPTKRPNGKPKIVARDVPIASIPMACVFLFFGATRITNEAVIAQKSECATAIHIRAMRRIQ